MRPTPGDELSAAAKILSATVGPAVDDAWARSQLDHVVQVMERLAESWSAAAPAIAAENERMTSLVVAVEPKLSGHAETAELKQRLRAAATSEPPGSSFETIAERNAELRQLVFEVIQAVEGFDTDWAQALQNEIRAALQANLAAALQQNE